MVEYTSSETSAEVLIAMPSGVVFHNNSHAPRRPPSTYVSVAGCGYSTVVVVASTHMQDATRGPHEILESFPTLSRSSPRDPPLLRVPRRGGGRQRVAIAYAFNDSSRQNNSSTVHYYYS